jgi:membrane protein DedA with SNARE-associated domain
MQQLAATFNDFLANYGLLAIFVVMLLKETGIPVPVPSDLIMITAGIQAGIGVLRLVDLIVAIAAAILIGGSIQFLLTRAVGRQMVYRLGKFVGLTPQRLDKALGWLERRGSRAVFLGLNIPGARAGIIPAAGVSKLTYQVFSPAMLAGSGVFYGWHIALGYVIGPAAETLFEDLQIPIVPVLLVGLGILGLVGWFLLRKRAKSAQEPEAQIVDNLHSWTHAACPACLTITFIQQRSDLIETD